MTTPALDRTATEPQPAGATSGAHAVTLIPGDGVGPEVVASARRLLEAAGVAIAWDERRAGAAVFRDGIPSGVPRDTLESIRRTGVVLKGPLETPVGYGEKSANVTLRKLFETYANVRPVKELPGVPTPYAGRGIDLVVVRENVEDLYAGIEHMQTPNVAQCLKLISRQGCEKIVRFAFELARAEGRPSVHCATKSNIMKLTEGLLQRTFEEIAPEYPEIAAHHIIVDNAAHQLVKRPEQFAVIVTTNLNGDILSDLASGLVGGLGFAPSGNYGDGVAIFEAVHGSAPKHAGKDVINPTAMILSATMMLRHLGETDAAARIDDALRRTLGAGVATRDAAGDDGLTTSAFTEAVVANLEPAAGSGSRPSSAPARAVRIAPPAVPSSRHVIGVDIFVESNLAAETLGNGLERIAEGSPFRLKMMSNRGTMLYPPTGATTDAVDHWRCRFVLRDGGEVADADILDLLSRVGAAHRWMHLEKLQEFDGEPAYTKAQGED
jgi:isocitrate dehydrogenase